ncbi:MAG: 3D domain-containing protein [Patescibacteria group bacterium]|nr:3D domain-containing protein [Patescibacteria group bacterium]MDD5715563.1 3D domain-containing protein [Patescibacteria group bacterium]
MMNFLNPKNKKVKPHIAIMATILFWQLCFPHNASAHANLPPNEAEQLIAQLSGAAPANGRLRLPEVGFKPVPPAKRTLFIPVTAYSSTVDQCGSDPFTTASGTKVHDGVIAANFLPIGTKVRFPEQFGNKIFVVEDRMSARYWQRADIWMPDRESAIAWGIQRIKIEIL